MNLKLRSLLSFLFGICAVSTYSLYDPMSYVDRLCGQDLTNLWVDVVAVMDNSHGMTDDHIQSIAATLSSVVSAGTRIGTNYTDPRSTRLALVTYNSAATTQADLNVYQSLDDVYNGVFPALSTVSKTDTSYLANGLAMAEQILQSQKNEFDRGHFKQAVIVFASAYKGSGELDPLPVADRLITSGVQIITAAYKQQGDGALLDQLSKIASPRYNFSNEDLNVLGEIQGALLEINCFCPSDWIQHRVSYSDVTSFPYGSCLQPIGFNAAWKSAQFACRNKKEKNSYLVTEYSQQKHDFVLESVKNTTGFGQPYSYHIGLNLAAGKWVWDQPAGWPNPQLKNWYNWMPTYPIASSSMSASLNLQNGLKTMWQNIGMYNTGANYVCETYSCDTDNYCDASILN